MTKVQNYSFHDGVLERFNKLVPAGQRSTVVSQLVSDYCDKLEGEDTRKILYNRWIEVVLSPFIKKYSADNKIDPFVLWSYAGIVPILHSAGIEATQEDVRRSIEYLLKEEK